MLPEVISEIIGDRSFVIDEIGKSDSQVFCFDDMVLKIEQINKESDNEYNMMKWLQKKIPVPEIICYQKENDINYMLMSRIKGKMLCSDFFLSHPEKLIKVIIKMFNLLWSVDISDCPYNNCLDNKLRFAEERVNKGLCSMEDCEIGTYGKNGFKSPEQLLEWLKANKPDEIPVFSHGDLCLPNVFADNGEITGFIDLGRCGIADKYQDIALCYRSICNNIGGKYNDKLYKSFNVQRLFDELQIKPDMELIRYYILLDELF